MSALEILPLKPPADYRYGDFRNHLTRQRRSIGPNDLLIVAHARAADLSLLTANTR